MIPRSGVKNLHFRVTKNLLVNNNTIKKIELTISKSQFPSNNYFLSSKLHKFIYIHTRIQQDYERGSILQIKFKECCLHKE